MFCVVLVKRILKKFPVSKRCEIRALFNYPFPFVITDVVFSIFLYRLYTATYDNVVFVILDTLTVVGITKINDDVPLLNGMTEDRVTAALEQVQMLLHHVRLERGQLCCAIAAEVTGIRNSLVPGLDVQFEVACSRGRVVAVCTWMPDFQVFSVLQEVYIHYYYNLNYSYIIAQFIYLTSETCGQVLKQPYYPHPFFR